MSSAAHEQLLLEHRALMRHCGEAQARCSQHARAQAEELAHLRAQVMRLRAAVVLRDTILAWAPALHR